MLIPFSDCRADQSAALYWAASFGHAECVKLLIPFSDCMAANSRALAAAAYGDSEDCLNLLIPVSHPLLDIEGLLDEVIEEGKSYIAQLLIDREPRLLDGLDLQLLLDEAIEGENASIVPFLSSLIDRRALREDLAEAPARRNPLARL